MAKEINENGKLIVAIKEKEAKLKISGDSWGSLSLDEHGQQIENKFNSIQNLFNSKQTEFQELNDSVNR